MIKITKQDLKNILNTLIKIAVLHFVFILVRIMAGFASWDNHSSIRVLPEISYYIIPIISLVLFIIVPIISIYFLVKLKLSNKIIKSICAVVFGLLSAIFSFYLFFSIVLDLMTFDLKHHRVITNNNTFYIIETVKGSFLEGSTAFELYKKIDPFRMLKISSAQPAECWSTNGECENKIASGEIDFVVEGSYQQMVYNISKNTLSVPENK